MPLTARAMRVGPSDSDCRVRIQTTNSGVGSMTEVVSVLEKASVTRQVGAGKTNVSEPLLTCRKAPEMPSKPDLRSWSGSKTRTGPADGPRGGRHTDGVSPVQAQVWNVGTCRLDAKGAIQVGVPQEWAY